MTCRAFRKFSLDAPGGALIYDLYKDCELTGRLWGYRRGSEFVITDMVATYGAGTFGAACIRQMMRDISADEPVTKFRGTHLGGRGLRGAGARQGCPMRQT